MLTLYVASCGQGPGGNGQGPSWHITIVDTVGYFPSPLALDSAKRPHICYRGYLDPGDIAYAGFNGSSWLKKKVISNLYDFNIAIDGNDIPHIFYRNGNDLYQATLEGSTLIKNTVQAGARPENISAAIHSSGKIYVIYYKSNTTELRCATKETGTLWIDSVITVEVVSDASIALDGSGNPHVSYKGAEGVIYAKLTGPGWDIQLVTGEAGRYTSIAMDSSDNPSISYYAENVWDLKYAKLEGSVWEIETVESDGSAGKYSSLSFDSSNMPHICYIKDNIYIRHAWWTGITWEAEGIDFGEYVSSVMTSSGKPKVAYTISGDLKFAEYH